MQCYNLYGDIMLRYFIIVKGLVQNVGFRVFCKIHALNYNLTGTIRNLENGMVEIFIQGKEENIKKFVKEIKLGNKFIKVEDMSFKQVSLVENEKNFKIIY